jgi:hypothetical protein
MPIKECGTKLVRRCLLIIKKKKAQKCNEIFVSIKNNLKIIQ